MDSLSSRSVTQIKVVPLFIRFLIVCLSQLVPVEAVRLRNPSVVDDNDLACGWQNEDRATAFSQPGMVRQLPLDVLLNSVSEAQSLVLDHSGQLTTPVLRHEANNFATEQADCIFLKLLHAVTALTSVVLFDECLEVTWQVDEGEREVGCQGVHQQGHLNHCFRYEVVMHG